MKRWIVRSCAAMLVGLLMIVAPALAAKQELVISTWGYGYDIFKGIWQEPFEQRYDCKIAWEFGNNSERANKLRMFKNNPRVDVVQITDYFAQMLTNEGILEDITEAEVPNLAYLYDFAKRPLKNGTSPAYTIGRCGIVYRTDVIKQPITSWKDLWRADVQGKLALPDVTTTQGPMVMEMTARILGCDLKNIDAVFNKLAELKKGTVKFYMKSSELINMFTRGEVAVAPTQAMFFRDFVKAGLPVAWVDPVEGTPAVINVIAVVKGAPHEDLAMKYVNYMLSKEVQYESAMKIKDSPVNKLVQIPEDARAGLTYGEDVIKNLVLLDWDYVLQHWDAWVERWNREIAK
ncbi:MAG: ABC transporter substrate-binding protein [Bacillota bacterium]|nr:ABC transporter substrate-binding protein [Bacillota bacterium]